MCILVAEKTGVNDMQFAALIPKKGEGLFLFWFRDSLFPKNSQKKRMWIHYFQAAAKRMILLGNAKNCDIFCVEVCPTISEIWSTPSCLRTLLLWGNPIYLGADAKICSQGTIL
jgi:hypothetical protein